MRLPAFLKLIAPIPVLVGLLHVVLGLEADAMLGANLPEAVIGDPALDSQNRFYGTSFMLYGAVLYLAGTDLRRYRPVLRLALWIFFAAGLARLLSLAIHGVPPAPVILLLLSEVIGAPLLLWWLAREALQPDA